MAWSFHKRIKIIPGVHLNLSKSGISTSIGVKGASMTFGKSGTYLNTSLPLLNINNRYKLSDSNTIPDIYDRDAPLPLFGNIFSADVQEITSQNMAGVKEAILLARQQRKELRSDLRKIQAALGTSKMKLILSYLFLYGLINKTISKDLKLNIEAQKEAIKQTTDLIDHCYVKLDVEFDPEIKEKYDQLVKAFGNLTTSHKIWDVTSAHFQDRVAARSSASTIVSKRGVRFSFKSLAEIRSDFEALYFENANGADLYFYPSFIVMYANQEDFAIIGLDEINVQQSYVRFTETGAVPRDSKVIDRTWAKVNKNGTPDKRFKGNYQIPIAKYGQIKLRTITGLNEEYEVSHYEFTEAFGQTFRAYQTIIKYR